MPLSVSLLLVAQIVIGPDVGTQTTSTGSLSENVIISSDELGYDLQYRVYVPAGYENSANLPVLFATDGQWYIGQGNVPAVMDQLIADRRMEPAIAVFIDNRNPHRLQENRRNRQFFCNEDYVSFVTDELIPEIDANYKTSANREDRVMLGLSFGGLNSACFGLLAHESFEGIAMQSPATHPVPRLINEYRDGPVRPIKIFLSTGDHNDNEAVTRRFREVLAEKGYEMEYKEVPFAHNWRNWGPLIDDVLVYFFGR